MERRTLFQLFRGLFDNHNGIEFRENVIRSFDQIYGRRHRPWRAIVSELHEKFGAHFTYDKWKANQSNIDKYTAEDSYYIAMVFWLYVRCNDPKIGQKCRTELEYISRSLWASSFEERCQSRGLPNLREIADGRLDTEGDLVDEPPLSDMAHLQFPTSHDGLKEAISRALTGALLYLDLDCVQPSQNSASIVAECSCTEEYIPIPQGDRQFFLSVRLSEVRFRFTGRNLTLRPISRSTLQKFSPTRPVSYFHRSRSPDTWEISFVNPERGQMLQGMLIGHDDDPIFVAYPEKVVEGYEVEARYAVGIPRIHVGGIAEYWGQEANPTKHQLLEQMVADAVVSEFSERSILLPVTFSRDKSDEPYTEGEPSTVRRIDDLLRGMTELHRSTSTSFVELFKITKLPSNTFEGVVLDDIDFRGEDLSFLSLARARLRNCTIDESTILPNGFSEDQVSVAEYLSVTHERGISARAAAGFVKIAEKFDVSVWASRNGIVVSGESLLGLMMLATKQKLAVLVEVAGREKYEALAAFREYFRTGFGFGA